MADHPPGGENTDQFSTNPQSQLAPETVLRHIHAGLCPYCGKGPFDNLAGHTRRAHGYGKQDLCDAAGLTYASSITSPRLNTLLIEKGRTRDMDPLRKNINRGGPRKLSLAAKELNRQKLEKARRVSESSNPGKTAVEVMLEAAAAKSEKRRAVIETAILDGLENGLTYGQISEGLGMANITRHVRRMQLPDGRSRAAAQSTETAAAKARNQQLAAERRAADSAEWEAGTKDWASVEQMAKNRGISVKSMRARLKRLGINIDGRATSPRVGLAKRTLSDADVVAMRRAFAEGVLIQQLAATFAVHPNTASDAIHGRGRFVKVIPHNN